MVGARRVTHKYATHPDFVQAIQQTLDAHKAQRYGLDEVPTQRGARSSSMVHFLWRTFRHARYITRASLTTLPQTGRHQRSTPEPPVQERAASTKMDQVQPEQTTNPETPQPPAQGHGPHTSCSLIVDAEAALNTAVSCAGQANPKDENRDTTCRKSTATPTTDKLRPAF